MTTRLLALACCIAVASAVGNWALWERSERSAQTAREAAQGKEAAEGRLKELEADRKQRADESAKRERRARELETANLNWQKRIADAKHSADPGDCLSRAVDADVDRVLRDRSDKAVQRVGGTTGAP